jgi:hypothetical protein
MTFARRARRAAGLAALCAAAILGSTGQAQATVVSPTCNLGPGGAIKHVIVMQFDNTHLARDAEGVKSDLEQMPA